jgi:Tol biopolymer transport system component
VNTIHQPETMSGLALSPDGQTMAFSYQYFGMDKTRHTRTLGFYNFEKSEFSLFVIPSNQVWSKPSYSWDGKKMVFTISPVTENGLHWDKKKFAVMNLSDFSYEIITPDWGMRFWPSFSPDGDRILYRKPAKIRNSGKTRYKYWDIWKMDISGAEMMQLTFYKYYQLWECFFLSDSERIIFTGSHSRSISKEEDQTYHEKYGEYTTLIIPTKNIPKTPLALRPLVTTESNNKYYKSLILAGITKSDDILYTAITNKMDRDRGINTGKRGYNYDLFIRMQDGEITRLTRAKSMITDGAISLDGSKVVFQSDKERNKTYSYWSINGNGTELFEIKLPKRQENWQLLKPKYLKAIN